MRRSYLAIAMGIMMGASLLNGCIPTTSSTTNIISSSSNDSGTIYGEISEISDSEITIQVGSMKEMSSEKPENSEMDVPSDNDNQKPTSQSDDSSEATNSNSSDNTDSSTDNEKKESSDKNDSEVPSIIDKSGEEKTITVNSNTKITKQNMGGPRQAVEAPGGVPSSAAPKKPSDDGQSDSTQSNGTPEKPSDDSQPNDTREKSSNDSQSNDTSEKSSDKNRSNTDSNKTQTTEQSSNETIDKPENNSNKNENEEISLSDISKGDIVSITFDDDGNAEEITVVMSANNGPGGGGGSQSQAPNSYDTNTEYIEDTEEEKQQISSDGTDENAIHASNGAKVSLSNFNITRNSSNSQGGDSSSFYGVGATVLESDGILYLKDSTIESDAKGAAGIFAYGDGIVYAADTKIKTTQSTSGGIHAAGAGTLYAWDMDVETSGESAAAIRSDRGGGTMVVNGGTYTSNGVGSPAIYSTANIAVNNADLTANVSEAVCIEGLNSLRLYNSNLTGNMSDNEQNDCTWNVILYQSMSGDSEVGNSTFEMNGGTLTAKNGGMFYTTNTESTFVLSDVDITYADDNDFFLRCTGNNNQRGWGTFGKNGADCHFTAAKQEMKGDIIWDSISMLDFYITKNSSLTGTVTNDETYAGNGGDGYCNLYIEKGSVWTVTGNSTLTNLENAGTIVDENGKTVTIKGTDGTVYIEGDSEYTVTVKSYKNSADISNASDTTEWSDYEVERPSEL